LSTGSLQSSPHCTLKKERRSVSRLEREDIDPASGIESLDPQIINSILHAKSAIYTLPPRLQAEVEQALANSISWTFVAGCIAAALCLASSLPIRERNLDEKHLNPSKPIDHDPSEGEV
jgi:hypothetical protein